jgi:hypothetical protein
MFVALLRPYRGCIANSMSVTEDTVVKPNIPVMVVAIALAAPIAINATEQHVGRDAERGDPQRWDEPVRTPQQRYENQAKEAAAALAEAIKECRGADHKRACVSAAREQHRRDLEDARSAASRQPQD